jgi:hypothetical protein
VTARRLLLVWLGLRWVLEHALDLALGAAFAVILVVLFTRCTHRDVDVDRGPPALRYLATCPV